MLKLNHPWSLTPFKAYVYFYILNKDNVSQFSKFCMAYFKLFLFLVLMKSQVEDSWKYYVTELNLVKMIRELAFFWCASRNRPHTMPATPGVIGHRVVAVLLKKKILKRDINFLPHVGKEAKIQWAVETSQGPLFTTCRVKTGPQNQWSSKSNF